MDEPGRKPDDAAPAPLAPSSDAEPRPVEEPESVHADPATQEAGASSFVIAAVAGALLSAGLAAGSSGLPVSWIAVTVSGAIAAGAVAVFELRRQGELRDALRYRPGDVLKAVAIGAAIFAACYAVSRGLAPGIPALQQDLARLASDARQAKGSHLLLVGLVLAVSEELVFRGLLQRAVASRAGDVRAVGIAAVVQALAWLPSGHPTLVLLGLLAGIGCGIAMVRLERVLPALLAHATVVYLLSTFPPFDAR